MQTLGIGHLIDTAWEQYRAQFTPLLRVSSWFAVVALINLLAISFYPIDAARLTRDLTALEISAVALLILNILFAVVVGIWCTNALIDLIHTQNASFKPLAKRAWSRFWPQLQTQVLLWIIYPLSVLIPFGVMMGGIHLGAIGFSPLLAILIILLGLVLFAPAFVLTISLAFSSYHVVCEDQRGLVALRESARRVHAAFGATLLRLVLPKILYFGIFFLLQFFIVTTTDVVLLAVFGDGTDASARLRWMTLIVSYAGLFVLLNPLLLMTDYHIYKQLKA